MGDSLHQSEYTIFVHNQATQVNSAWPSLHG